MWMSAKELSLIQKTMVEFYEQVRTAGIARLDTELADGSTVKAYKTGDVIRIDVKAVGREKF